MCNTILFPLKIRSYVTEITISSRGCKSLEQQGFRSKYLTAVERIYQNLSFTMYKGDVNKLEYLENVHKLYLNGYVDDSIIPQIREKLTKAWRIEKTSKYYVFYASLWQLIVLLKPYCFISLLYCYMNNVTVISETIIKHKVNTKVQIYTRLKNLNILFTH